MFSCKTRIKDPPQIDQQPTDDSADEDLDDDEICFINDNDTQFPDTQFYCELCDKHFQTHYFYNNHLAQHRRCGIDDCRFIGDDEIVEKHIASQHLTGLYDKIRKLDTPEDIERWREERRLKHPSNRENLEKRCEAEMERFERGEKLYKKNERFNRNNKTRFVKQDVKKRNRRQKNVIDIKPQRSLIDEKCNWNGDMFPFRGTNQLYNVESSDDDDCEIEENRQNGLGAIMGAYLSDNSGDKSSSDDDEGEPPIEEKIEKCTQIVETFEIPNKQTKICKKNKKQVKQHKPLGSFDNIKFVKRPRTLLEQLLQDEIRHERNVLLQCVQYVVDNDFFRNN